MLCCFRGPPEPAAAHDSQPAAVAAAAPVQRVVSACSSSPPAPWSSAKELSDLLAKLSDTRGPWLSRLQTCSNILADFFGAALVSVWACSSDQSVAVVLASAGLHQHVLPPGASVVLADAAGQQPAVGHSPVANKHSLQRIVAEQSPITCTTAAQAPGSTDPQAGAVNGHAAGEALPPADWQQLSTAHGLRHFAGVPLRHGGRLVGAMGVALRGHAQAQAPDGPPSFSPLASATQGAPTTSGSSWLPHHTAELQQVALLLAAQCLATPSQFVGVGVPLQQHVADMAAALRHARSLQQLVRALGLGLQDLAAARCGLQFAATPMLLHRSGATAALFQLDVPAVASAAKEGSPSLSGLSFPPSEPKAVKALVTRLSHTALLQLVLGDSGHWPAGRIIQNCGEHMQDDGQRGRDISLCHKAGVAQLGSLVMAVGSAAARSEALVGLYLSSREPLPAGVLEGVLLEVQMALKVLVPVVSSQLGQSELASEWAQLHNTLLSPAAVPSSTLHTPRTMSMSTAHSGPAAHLQGGSSGAASAAAAAAGLPPAALGAIGGGPPARECLSPASATEQYSLTKEGAHSESMFGVGGAGGTVGGGRPHDLSFLVEDSCAAQPSASRSNLGLMVNSIRSSLNQVLAQRAAQEADSSMQDDIAGVELVKQIGQGGQGVVFCGLLHGLEVAIKVVGTEDGADMVYDLDDEGQALKLKRVLKRDATELAVTTTVSHPNIVQVFSYFMDVMVVEYVGEPDRFKLLPKPQRAGSGMHTHSGATPPSPHGGAAGSPDAASGGAPAGGGDSQLDGPSNMIICMEYCDAGSLKQAVKRGAFRQAGAVRPNMQALYTTLMEVALALRHLHGMRLVHCDLKPSNVLLKSSMRDPRGWVCKLSDFGCVRLMSEAPSGGRPSFNLEYAVGTPTHMAPEMFCKGHPLDAAVDVYSFGILMWELYVAMPVYEGVAPDKLPYHVVKRGLRPAFATDTPSAYRSLAHACWASEPRARPTAAALVTVLQRLLASSVASSPQGSRPQSSVALGGMAGATAGGGGGGGSQHGLLQHTQSGLSGLSGRQDLPAGPAASAAGAAAPGAAVA